VIAANTSETGNTWHHEIPRGLVLGLTPGTAGAQNSMTVNGATPNALVSYYTGQNQGSSNIARSNCPQGITIGIASPIQLGTARANASGVATLTMNFPANLAGQTFHFQAIEGATCRASNRVTDQL
jgi:hypothetical protein